MKKMKEEITNIIINKLVELIYEDYINEHYVKCKEVEQADAEFHNLYLDNKLFEDVKISLDFSIISLTAVYEKQGFIMGFKRAVEILSGGNFYE